MIIKNYEEDKEIRVFLVFFSGIDTRLLVRDCLLIVTDSDIFVRVMDLKGEKKNEKIIVSEFVTLDGIMKAPERWVFPYWNEEIGKFKFNELFASDALLLGRVTYQIFVNAWPSLTDEENWRRVKEAGG